MLSGSAVMETPSGDVPDDAAMSARTPGSCGVHVDAQEGLAAGGGRRSSGGRPRRRERDRRGRRGRGWWWDRGGGSLLGCRHCGAPWRWRRASVQAMTPASRQRHRIPLFAYYYILRIDGWMYARRRQARSNPSVCILLYTPYAV
jgi:hypothetical protein